MAILPPVGGLGQSEQYLICVAYVGNGVVRDGICGEADCSEYIVGGAELRKVYLINLLCLQTSSENVTWKS